MTAKVADLMVRQVVSATPHHTVTSVRALMHEHRIHALPVLDSSGELVGLISSSDLLNGADGTAPVGAVMTDEVQTIPAYADVSTAARMMRNHRIHHLVVTEEGRMIGILSSYDLLKMVEEHRYVPKNQPKSPGRPRAPRHRKQGKIRD